ncbi:hypothetical protein HYS48_03080 [Candidatus Woesearchaeota archaeon]|nr:hypothetical protein [Candidatus Woesearchaeota archaeon]
MGKQEEGAKALQAFFKSHNIASAYREKKINLKHEVKEYVLPDFYLAGYDIFVEFMSGWDDPKQRPRLLEKLEIAERNSLPILFLYPNELKDLPFHFEKKFQDMMRRKNISEKERKAERFYNLLAVVCFFLGIPLMLYRITRVLGILFSAYGFLLFMMRNYKEIGSSFVQTFQFMGKLMGRLFRVTGKGVGVVGKGVGKGSAAAGKGLFHFLGKFLVYCFRGIILFFKFVWACTKVVLEYLQEGFLTVKELMESRMQGRGRRIRLRKR